MTESVSGERADLHRPSSRARLADAKKVGQARVHRDRVHPDAHAGPRDANAVARCQRLARVDRVAGVLASVGARPGRRAAAQGLSSIAVTPAVVNVAVKRIWRRARPERLAQQAVARRVRMPTSLSFPSGHSAAAFAFSTGVGAVCRSSRCRRTPRPESSPIRACTPESTIPATLWSALASAPSLRNSPRTRSITTGATADHSTVRRRGAGSVPDAAAGWGRSGEWARVCPADLAERAREG